MRETAPVAYRAARTAIGWSLPAGAQLAIWVIPNVEHFPLDYPVPGGTGTSPDVHAFSVREYGLRVGYWRFADAFAEFEIAPTVALNSDVCLHYPELTAHLAEMTWEIIGHGRSNSHRLSEMSDDDERDTLATVRRTVQRHFDAAPRGWLGPGLQESWSTLDRLAELGFDYVADWCLDDRPDEVSRLGLTTLPYSNHANDKIAVDLRGASADEFADLVVREAAVLHREGATDPRVLGVALHPYVMGTAHRIDALRRMLDSLKSLPNVWWASGSDIVDAYRATGPARE
jgi:allantoinase